MSARVNAEVILTDGMTSEEACRRLKKLMIKGGLFAEMKQRSFYLKPGERKRLKAKRARKRERKQGHYWEAARLRDLDRTGASDSQDRPTPRRREFAAAQGAATRQPARAATTAEAAG